MPLVEIDAPSLDDTRLGAVADAVQAALVDTMAVPPDDRFAILRGTAGTAGTTLVADPGFLGIRRDQAQAVFVRVTLRRGRDDARKRRFQAALADRARTAGVDPRNLVVVLTENGLGDWSFGDGGVPYLDHPPAGAAGRPTLREFGFGPGARDRLSEASDPSATGADAALETFYHALHRRDLDLMRQVWAEDDLAQLDNPVGGIVRGAAGIEGVYARLFTSGMSLRVTFGDAATWHRDGSALFAGRERGEFAAAGAPPQPLAIRTSRWFSWHADVARWRQDHHHGSIDDPELLAAYRRAAGADRT